MPRCLPMALICLVFGTPRFAAAQAAAVDSPVTQTVYEFQLNYQLPWQRWYGGPGLSVGGTMPTRGVFGYSSLNGIPLPPPLGAGVYVNSPLPHSLSMPGYNLPGPLPFGPGFGNGPGPAAFPNGMAPPAWPGPNNLSPNPAPLSEWRSPAETQNLAASRLAPSSGVVARLKSIEHQSLGDEQLRKQQWGQAYVHYRRAVEIAPERSQPHFRLAIAFTAKRLYASAVREFSRSLVLDPTLPISGDRLETIFGSDSRTIRTSLLQQVADWVRTDVRDPDRLFLLGLLLHFNDDPRGSEVLEAALKVVGDSDHVVAAFFQEPPIEELPIPAAREIPDPEQSPAGPSRATETHQNSPELPPAPMPFEPESEPPSTGRSPR